MGAGQRGELGAPSLNMSLGAGDPSPAVGLEQPPSREGGTGTLGHGQLHRFTTQTLPPNRAVGFSPSPL